MQIYGIGTDIVQIKRIQDMWDAHGLTFARKVLSTYELEALDAQKTKHAAFIAKRFAAKEAVAKALGTGFRDEVIITQIGVETANNGKPELMFYGKTREYINALENLEFHVSLSDEADYVVAFVIILKK